MRQYFARSAVDWSHELWMYSAFTHFLCCDPVCKWTRCRRRSQSQAQALVSPRTNNINGHCCCTRRMCHTQFAEGKWSWDRLYTYQLVKHIQGGVVQGVKGRSGYCRQSQSALRSSDGRGGIGATKTNTSNNMFMV